MKPYVSIISVNYNQAEVTCELIKSIRKLSYKDIEIIVVDNGSTEDPSIIRQKYPEVNLIISPHNLGFAGGNNLGIKAAVGDYLFFVNNDTELTPHIIEMLLERFEKDSDIGMVSPKIKFYDHREIIQYAGYSEVNPYTARNHTIGKYEKDEGQYDLARVTPYGHGAAMMVRRDVINKVGYMPENFFLYYEELDWCEQIKNAGYKIYYEPRGVVYHKESTSIGNESILKTYFMTRNRILFMRRNTHWWHFMIFLIFFTLFSIPKAIFKYILKHQKQHLKAFFDGFIWNFSLNTRTAISDNLRQSLKI
jgi:GT2 family glycosyltransferase